MGYNGDCRDAFESIVSDFGADDEQPVLSYWKIMVAVKTLAHYSTAPECEELAEKLRKVVLNPDEDNPEQMAVPMPWRSSDG